MRLTAGQQQVLLAIAKSGKWTSPITFSGLEGTGDFCHYSQSSRFSAPKMASLTKKGLLEDRGDKVYRATKLGLLVSMKIPLSVLARSFGHEALKLDDF